MNRADFRQTLGSHPYGGVRSLVTLAVIEPDTCRSSRGDQRLEVADHLGAFVRRHESRREEHIVHFVRVTWRRAFFLAYPVDRRQVERPEIGGAGWLAGSPRLHGVRASLLERRVVEEGVRPRIEDLVRKERRFRRVARDELQLATMDALEHGAEAVEIHGLLQAIVDRLLDERMIRNLAIAGNVLQTGRGIGKDRRHQVVRQHPLQLRRDLAPAAAPRHGQRDRRVPTPPRLEHRRVEECLHQHVSRALGVQITEHVRERERMLWSERQQ